MKPTTLKNLIQAFQKNNILSLKTLNNGYSCIQYGPSGSLLKRNIFNEWLNSLVHNSETHLLAIENSIPRKPIFSSNASSNQRDDSLLFDAIMQYKQTLSIHGNQLPFGFAYYGPSMKNGTVESHSTVGSSDINDLKYLQARTHASVIFFCPSRKNMHWFYFWSKQRYLWWRKFSSIPSKFSMSDMAQTPTSAQQLSLLLEFPWEKLETLETISLCEGHSLQETCSNHNVEGFDGMEETSVITCESEMDLAVLAYLANAYAEKWRDAEMKQVFHLHYKLAPFKVSICMHAEDSEAFKNLKNVSDHLTAEFKKAGITIFPNSSTQLATLPKRYFDRFDSMGILYTIVLNENSLQSGVAGLRNRDTTLQEQIHITEITSKLVKYLKIS